MHFVYQPLCILFIDNHAFCLSTIMHFVYRGVRNFFIDNHAFHLSLPDYMPDSLYQKIVSLIY